MLTSPVLVFWSQEKDSGARTDRNSLDLRMRVLDCDVIQGEHAVEGFRYHLNLAPTLVAVPWLQYRGSRRNSTNI